MEQEYSQNSHLSQDYDILTEELHSVYIKLKGTNSKNKKDIIKDLFKIRVDFPVLFTKLIDYDYIEEILFLIENFKFDPKENFLELFFYSIEKHKNNVVESIIKQDLFNLLDTKDKDGNTALIISVIYSNLQSAKMILQKEPSIIEVKNNNFIDPIKISVFNNDSLMFFLLVNSLNSPVIPNIHELCKLSIRNENLTILEFLAKKDSNIFSEDTLLHFACSQKNTELFRYVLKNTNDLDFRDEMEEAALHWGVMKGSYNIVEELVLTLKERNFQINPRNKYGVNPFFLACLKQDKLICQLLYDNGADVNECDEEGNSVIHMIASIGDVKWLKYVVNKFNLNCYLKNKHGNTPFMVACIAAKYDIVEYFMDKIPNLNWKNNKGQTPLHAAVHYGHKHIIELLLRNKADITIKDINGLTPYHYAFPDKKKEIIELIHQVLMINS